MAHCSRDPALVSFSSLPVPPFTFLTQRCAVGVTFALINLGAICSCLPSFDVTPQMVGTGHSAEQGTRGASNLPCLGATAESQFHPG